MLSVTTEYALRALSRLAALPSGEVMLGRELAESTGIPLNYLGKIMLTLRNAGLVSATRGLGGGYSLQRPSQDIHLVEIVEVFEGPLGRPPCLLGINRECTGEEPCSAHRAWGAVRDAYLNFLRDTTLNEIALSAGQAPWAQHGARAGGPQL